MIHKIYLGSSRGRGGGGGGWSLSSFSPVCDNISLIAPTLESIADVSTGMKITFELLLRVMSRKLSMYRTVIRYCTRIPTGNRLRDSSQLPPIQPRHYASAPAPHLQPQVSPTAFHLLHA